LRVEVGVVRESQDEVPQLELKIGNITSVPEAYANDYAGLIGSSVTFYEVNTNNLTETEDIRTLEVEITESDFNMLWANFKIGISPNPYVVKDPAEKMLKNFCRYKRFPHATGSRCPYTGGVYTTCNRSLAHCVQRLGADQSKRFGGFPAIGTNKLYVD